MRLEHLARLVAMPRRWACTEVRRIDERAIELSFSRHEDRLSVRVMAEPSGRRGFLRWPLCVLRYDGHLAHPDAQTKDEVSAILESVGELANRWLEEEPARTFAASSSGMTKLRQVSKIGEELKLNVNSPCGQSCEFCAVPRERIVASRLEELLEKVDEAAQTRAHTIRVTGIDPLTFEGILPLLARARDAGFATLQLHGPSTRLADESFCRAVLAASPPQRWFHVPLYGADATAHDAVVGVPGAFDRVIAALDNLARLERERCVTLHTVCTRRVLPSLPAIVALARARGLAFAADLPFPEREAEGDPYQLVAARQHEVADALAKTELTVEDLTRVSGLWPCALHARLDAPRANSLRLLADQRALQAPSIGARTPMIPCPHAGTCRWVPACSGNILRAYLTLHGDSELAPR